MKSCSEPIVQCNVLCRSPLRCYSYDVGRATRPPRRHQRVGSGVQRVGQTDNCSVIVGSERSVMCVEGEHQGQVVRIPSAYELRYAAGDLLTAAKEISAPQYGLDPIQLVERSDVEGH